MIYAFRFSLERKLLHIPLPAETLQAIRNDEIGTSRLAGSGNLIRRASAVPGGFRGVHLWIPNCYVDLRRAIAGECSGGQDNDSEQPGASQRIRPPFPASRPDWPKFTCSKRAKTVAEWRHEIWGRLGVYVLPKPA